MRLLLVLLLIVAPVASGQDAPIALTHVTVVNVETGERLPDHTVLVEADRITAVGPSAGVDVPAGAAVVDGVTSQRQPCDLVCNGVAVRGLLNGPVSEKIRFVGVSVQAVGV